MESLLREQIKNLLQNEHAHMPLRDAVKDFPITKINDKAPNVKYSFYALFYHIYFTQNDILDYITSPSYKDSKWPDDYWPQKGYIATKADWKILEESFEEDVKKLVTIAKNDNLERTLPNKQTILRELLVIADHNAYHIGELAILRQVTKTWEKGHAK